MMKVFDLIAAIYDNISEVVIVRKGGSTQPLMHQPPQ
jgi:hypothetical protein